MKSKILCLAASLRQDSINKKLARSAAVCTELRGASAQTLDLRDFTMPIYDGDIEATDGVPATARDLSKQIASARGLIICTPEYNGATPALLKNTLDWVSRVRPDDSPGSISGLNAMRMKPVLLLSATPGASAGARTLVVTRIVLSHLGFLVLPTVVGVGNASDGFSADGQLADDTAQQRLEQAVDTLIQYTS